MKNMVWDGKTDLKLNVKVDTDKICERTAKRCSNHLRAISPESKQRRSKPYKAGWEVRNGTKRNNESFYEVWNRTNYQLTHLLENGHIISNKKGGVGWASARPHIQNAVDFVRPQFIAEMEKAEVEVDFTKGK